MNGDIFPAPKEGGLYGSGKCKSYLTKDGKRCVSFVAFRGLKLPMKSIEFHQTMLNQKKRIILNGYLSTSLSEEMAMGYAFDGADPDNDRHPVIYKVHFKGN